MKFHFQTLKRHTTPWISAVLQKYNMPTMGYSEKLSRDKSSKNRRDDTWYKKRSNPKTMQQLLSATLRERDKDRRLENTRGKRWVKSCMSELVNSV